MTRDTRVSCCKRKTKKNHGATSPLPFSLVVDKARSKGRLLFLLRRSLLVSITTFRRAVPTTRKTTHSKNGRYDRLHVLPRRQGQRLPEDVREGTFGVCMLYAVFSPFASFSSVACEVGGEKKTKKAKAAKEKSPRDGL